jgi:hypothetical protein
MPHTAHIFKVLETAQGASPPTQWLDHGKHLHITNLSRRIVGVSISGPCSQGWSLEELTIPSRWQFGGPFLCIVVDIVEPKSLCVSRIPLKVVEKRPHEVTTHVGPFPLESEMVNRSEAYVWFSQCPERKEEEHADAAKHPRHCSKPQSTASV